jgi:hypothetical protein
MTRAKCFAGYCIVLVCVLFSWVLLISACSKNPITPAQADKPTTNSQNPATPAQANETAANSQAIATSAQADSPTTMKDCSDESKDGELSGWERMIKDEHDIYLYAVKLFNQPMTCKGDVESNADENRVGTIVFTFAGGSTFSIEASPPETSMTILRAPGGFPDEKEARSILEQYSQEIGVHIDWSKPKEESRMGDEQVFTYWDPDEGLNAGADMVYKDKKLVEIRFHMAL